jgi:signal peptidase I
VEASARTSDAPRSRAARRGSFFELPLIIAVAIGLALAIQALLIKPFVIPTGSMEPTLAIDQRVLVDRVSFRFTEPEVGDIVVFHPPLGATKGRECGAQHPPEQACPEPTSEPADDNYIKRVVGTPGDELSVVDGTVYVNGEPLDEPYVRQNQTCGDCNLPEEVTIPPGHFFMMGDNRGSSSDSRVWGPVPEEWIVGNAFFTYWPIPRIGTL